ncbi:MAG: hypothetical protein WKG06_01695 [Segetibacter sp.]
MYLLLNSKNVVITNEISKGNITSNEGTDTIIKIKVASGGIVEMITNERIDAKTNNADTPALSKAHVVAGWSTNELGRLS